MYETCYVYLGLFNIHAPVQNSICPSGTWDESTTLLILCNLVELVIILSVSYIFFHQKSYQYSGRNGKIKGKMKYKIEVLKKKSGMLNATQLK